MRPARTVATIVPLVALALVAATAPAAHAQLPNPDCLNCAVEVATVEWNGTGAPGTIVSGTFRIENTGESTDSYTVTVNASDAEWAADVDTDNTDDVPPGAGLLAADDNTIDIAVNVLIPEAAAAQAEAGITVTVTSDNDDSVTASTSVLAVATQIHAWTLDCTPNLSIQKTGEANITLEATNTGNGPDGATITTIGINGLALDDPEAVTANAGQTARQDLDVGVGLSLEDGDYALRWNLTSTKSPTTHANCTTTITVTGGAAPPGNENGGNESEDSPAAPAMALLLAAAWAARRQQHRA